MQYSMSTKHILANAVRFLRSSCKKCKLTYLWDGGKNYWSLKTDLVSFCSLQAFPSLKLCSGKHVTLVSDACMLRLYVILTQILTIWNLSLKFNIAANNMSISPQPCCYKWQEYNRCVQGRFLDSLPWAKLVNDIHSDTVQYKWGTLNGLN